MSAPGFKPLDVIAVGSWTNFDHLFRVDRLPGPGDTVRILDPITTIETTHWGGCAPNNAAAAAQLGARTALVSVVGRDFRERGYEAHLLSLGVDLRGTIVLDDDRCGHSFLFADPAGAAICLSHLGAAERQDAFEPDAAILMAAKVAVVNYRFDGFTLRAARQAAAGGAAVIVSGNLATAPAFAAAMLESAAMLVCTKHEFDQLAVELSLTSRDDLFARGARALVETRGNAGSVVYTPNGATTVAAAPARLVDPVGAGDAFVGGLATGIAFGHSVVDAARLGSAVASFVVEAVGCQTNLPTLEQAMERMRIAVRPEDRSATVPPD